MKTTMSGIQGEFIALAKLIGAGIIAAPTLKNSENVDILACSPNGLISSSIQVKTKTRKTKKWLLNKKNEGQISDSFFYIFINIETGHCYPVPSSKVARRIADLHKRWLAKPDRSGQQHNDINMREYVLDKEDLSNEDNVRIVIPS